MSTVFENERQAQKALEELSRSNPQGALELGGRLVVQFPNALPLHLAHIRGLRKAERWAEAHRVLSMLVQSHPSNQVILTEMAEVYFALGDYPQSGDMYNRVLFLDPFNAQARQRLDEIDQRRKDLVLKGETRTDLPSSPEGELDLLLGPEPPEQPIQPREASLPAPPGPPQLEPFYEHHPEWKQDERSEVGVSGAPPPPEEEPDPENLEGDGLLKRESMSLFEFHEETVEVELHTEEPAVEKGFDPDQDTLMDWVPPVHADQVRSSEPLLEASSEVLDGEVELEPPVPLPAVEKSVPEGELVGGPALPVPHAPADEPEQASQETAVEQETRVFDSYELVPPQVPDTPEPPPIQPDQPVPERATHLLAEEDASFAQESLPGSDPVPEQAFGAGPEAQEEAGDVQVADDEEPDPLDDAAFLTENAALLYIRQTLYEDALRVYETLYRRTPSDHLEKKIQATRELIRLDRIQEKLERFHHAVRRRKEEHV